MVIDKFKFLCNEAAYTSRFDYNNGISFSECDEAYKEFRQNLIDLIVELSQGASVDWDELNATMKDWR